MKCVRILFLMLVAVCAAWVQAASARAWWSVAPETPYVGQPYTLMLTIETHALDEIGNVDIPALPPETTAEVSYRMTGPHRHTTFRIRQQHPTARIVSIPESPIRVTVQTLVTSSQRIRHFSRKDVSLMVPAFSYTVKPLPEAAKDALLGKVAVTLTADKSTFAPGEVLELTATVTMTDGYLPESLPIALEAPATGRLYPFHNVLKTPAKCVAKAFYVAEGEAPVTLALVPLTCFDAATEKVTSATAAPLTITPRPQVEETPQTITLHLGKETVRGLPLRFAPREGALVIGALSEPYTCHESSGDWTRVTCATGAGWILTRSLGTEE